MVLSVGWNSVSVFQETSDSSTHLIHIVCVCVRRSFTLFFSYYFRGYASIAYHRHFKRPHKLSWHIYRLNVPAFDVQTIDGLRCAENAVLLCDYFFFCFRVHFLIECNLLLALDSPRACVWVPTHFIPQDGTPNSVQQLVVDLLLVHVVVDALKTFYCKMLRYAVPWYALPVWYLCEHENCELKMPSAIGAVW